MNKHIQRILHLSLVWSYSAIIIFIIKYLLGNKVINRFFFLVGYVYFTVLIGGSGLELIPSGGTSLL